MRSKFILAVFLQLLLSVWQAGAKQPNYGHRTYPSRYFLNIEDVANSMELLPAYPDSLSDAFQYDIARYQWGKSMRDTERGAQAVLDAKVDSEGIARAFSEAFGITISAETTPEIFRLLSQMKEDAGDLATRHAKAGYGRLRPYAQFNEDTCVPEDQNRLSKNHSYPSGHTSIGWATALVLAEINPARQTEILKRGLELGESRVICGFHYQSDVEAGRIVAAGVVARLHADHGFQAQLQRAKEEFAMLVEGKCESRCQQMSCD